MNSKSRKPKALPAKFDTIFPMVEWDDDSLKFESNKEWIESLERCYSRPPYDELKRYKFVYKPDGVQQREIKSKAAENALTFLMSKYDLDYEKDPNYSTQRPIFYGQMYYFFSCLRSFHPLTMHTKCKDFKDNYSKAQMNACPFGIGADQWRKHYKLDFLSNSQHYYLCRCQKPQQLKFMTTHLLRENDKFHLHEAVHQYVVECEKKLIKVSQYYVDRDDYSATIRRMDDSGPNPYDFNSDLDPDYDDDDVEDAEDFQTSLVNDDSIVIPNSSHPEEMSPPYLKDSPLVPRVETKTSISASPSGSKSASVILTNVDSSKDRTKDKSKVDGNNKPKEKIFIPQLGARTTSSKFDKNVCIDQRQNARYDRNYRNSSNDVSSNRYRDYKNYDDRDHQYRSEWKRDRDNNRYKNDHMRYKNDRDRKSWHNRDSYRDMGMDNNYYQDTRDQHNNQHSYQVLINNSRNRKENYNRDNIREDESLNTARSGSTSTCKRSYDDLYDNTEPVLQVKPPPKTLSTTTDTLKAATMDKTVDLKLLSSFLTLITNEIKKGNDNSAGYQRKKKKKRTSNNNERTSNNNEDRGSTVTYNELPIYLIEEECKQYRTASNGNQFIIRMVPFRDNDMLPVPVWKNDKRSNKQLKKHAKSNLRSRHTVKSAAQKLNSVATSTSSTSCATKESNIIQISSLAENTATDNSKISEIDNITKKKDSSYLYKRTCRSTNILLIGISYNKFVCNQYVNDSTISCMSECKDENGRTIDKCVARDTYRCFILEKTYPIVKVFTVNRCSNILRSCDNLNDPYNINTDVCTSQFMQLIYKKMEIS